MTKYSLLESAQAATSRSSLDVLRLPYPFSQVGLLSATEFARQAVQRHSRALRSLPMDEQVLEELHKVGVLVPLFRVDLTPGNPARQVDITESLTARHVLTTFIGELLRAASEGRAADPSLEAFNPWPGDRRRALWPTYDSGYLYSRYQLLGLDLGTRFVSSLRPSREESRTVWRLAEADRPNLPTIEALGTWRALAVTLAALETYYWPLMTHQVSHDLATWRAVRQDFDPGQMLTWLGLTVSQLQEQSQQLRTDAAFRDDTGDFYDLIRRSKAKAWESLRGDALTAMDFRLAADILDRFLDELTSTGAPPGHAVPLAQAGLSSSSHSLDAALIDLNLSPFPTLVIGVEGETEELLLPRVMELLGIEPDPNWIRIVEYSGTSRDLSMLARYAAEPVLGRDFGTSVALDRPFTRFLVLADAENRYATAADRRRQRRILIDSLARKVPPDLRGDLYTNSRLGRTVEIRTWGPLPFEFAHFTDRQLATALSRLARMPHPGGTAALIADIHRERRTTSPDIGDVRWPGRGRISKLALAEETWDILERRIKRAIARGHNGPPIMQAALRAYEMATVDRGVRLVLRRR